MYIIVVKYQENSEKATPQKREDKQVQKAVSVLSSNIIGGKSKEENKVHCNSIKCIRHKR